MININTIISSFDEEGTLLKWLKKVEDALKNASLKTVETVTIDDTSFKLKFVFADDTFLLSPTITSPQGAKGDTGPQGPQGPIGPTGPQGPAGKDATITAESVNAVMEGSDFISVDFNQQSTKLLVELDQTKLDELPTEDSNNLVKSGGVFDALAGKLDANKNAVASVGGLVSPSQAPTVIEFVGIDSTGAQVRIQADTNDFEIDGTTSPYTLKKKQAASKTWLLNSELTINEAANYNVNFISYELTFNSLRMEVGKITNLYYGNELVYAKDPVGGATWYDTAFRTVSFVTAPTGDLLAWLQANGVNQ